MNERRETEREGEGGVARVRYAKEECKAGVNTDMGMASKSERGHVYER